MKHPETKIAIIGLGYVGLPLAVEFGKKYCVVGYDINKGRVEELRNGWDKTLEVDAEDLKSATHLGFSTQIEDIADCNYFIVTVPTPVDKDKRPDLSLLIKASETAGKVLKKGDIVIYESTVYPGCTEEDCVPVLERISGLTFNKDFFCGYSPERINPGDQSHRLTKIKKVTSGSTPEAALKVDALYKSIIEAGTYMTSTIRVAEAAKVIENAQRDLNIAFVNELAKIFNRMDIDTNEVLNAAATKWNFLNFRPGLVGGHCIGVDPFYLTHKAQKLGYHPEIILAGRRLNDGMGSYIASQVVKKMIRKGQKVEAAEVLVLGITFKENCPDVRNSKVIDIVRELEEYQVHVDVYDPWADKTEVAKEYCINLVDKPDVKTYDAIVLAVAHQDFLQLDYPRIKNGHAVLFDVKSFLPAELADARL